MFVPTLAELPQEYRCPAHDTFFIALDVYVWQLAGTICGAAQLRATMTDRFAGALRVDKNALYRMLNVLAFMVGWRIWRQIIGVIMK